MRYTIENARLSYVNLMKAKPPFGDPNGEPMFSVTILIPKSDTKTKETLDNLIQSTVTEFDKWPGGKVPAFLTLPIHDGDGQKPRGGSYGPECKGMWVVNAKTKDKPFVVDAYGSPIIDPAEVYSGMWGAVAVNSGAYANKGNNGVSFWLDGVLKLRDDEALGGNHTTAEEAFAGLIKQYEDGI